MALDGAFLYAVKNELDILIGAKCDKIFQPSNDEIIVMLRTFSGTKRLLISANANNARVHITQQPSDNPKTPPMFCMLLRKRLCGGKLVDIRQSGLDRILFFDFECINELGDIEILTLAAEIMGRHSNIVLVDSGSKVIDSIKRIGTDKSRVRLVLPNITYTTLPDDGKISFVESDADAVISRIAECRSSCLSKSIIAALQGVSPILAREWSYAASSSDKPFCDLSDSEINRLKTAISQTRNALVEKKCDFTIVYDQSGNLKDFSFIKIYQYGTLMQTQTHSCACQTLEHFYSERDASLRLRQRADDLFKLLSSAQERLLRKIALQKEELLECSRKDYFKLCGDLISANLYKLSKGDTILVTENFYDENMAVVEIPLDSTLTPSQNAQKYYNEYRKKSTAQIKLTQQIELASDELAYIESVSDSLTRAQTEDDVMLLRQELISSGYLKARKAKGIKPREMPPYCFHSSDGFEILVGRNNVQNDKLTFKIAQKSDVWLHTKDIPGSHVIIITNGFEASETAILEAAVIAARHSKANGSNQVPVDWCLVKYVKKPNGAKPGKVIFTHNKTVFVDSLEKIGDEDI